MALRLTRRAHRNHGEVVVVVDEATHQRLADAGLDRWLHVARDVQQAYDGLGLPGPLAVASKASP